MSPKEKTEMPIVVEAIRNGLEGKGGVKSLGVNGFARASGISPALITRYLQGKVGEPTTATLQKLADYFGVSVAYLRGEDPELGSNTLEFVSESFTNLDLPESVTSQIGVLILNNLSDSLSRIVNKEDYNTVFKDAIIRFIRIINILAPYYKHQGALGDNPYKNSPYLNSEKILFDQLKGLLELDISKDAE